MFSDLFECGGSGWLWLLLVLQCIVISDWVCVGLWVLLLWVLFGCFVVCSFRFGFTVWLWLSCVCYLIWVCVFMLYLGYFRVVCMYRLTFGWIVYNDWWLVVDCVFCLGCFDWFGVIIYADCFSCLVFDLFKLCTLSLLGVELLLVDLISGLGLNVVRFGSCFSCWSSACVCLCLFNL